MIHNCDYVSPHAHANGGGSSSTAQAEHVESLRVLGDPIFSFSS